MELLLLLEVLLIAVQMFCVALVATLIPAVCIEKLQ